MKHEDIHLKKYEEEIEHQHKEVAKKISKIKNEESVLRTCKVCHNKVKRIISKRGFHISKCKKCGFMFTNPQPNKEQLELYYNSKMKALENKLFKKTEKERLKIFDARVKQIFKHIFAEGELLDVGGAQGIFIKSLGPYYHKFKLSVVDINKESCSELKKTNKEIKVYNKDVMEHKKKYDVITLWDTIEHLTNIKNTITKIRKLLNTNGYLFMTTPNTNSFEQITLGKEHPQIEPIPHVNYFDKDNIRMFLEQNGFKVISIQTLNASIDISLIQSLSKELQGKFFHRQLADKSFCEDFKRLLIKNCLGGNMLVIAIKKTKYK